MRTATVLLLSLIAHAAVVLIGFALLTGPRMLAAVPPQTIEVDIVRPDEVAKPPDEPRQEQSAKQQPTPPQQPIPTQPQAAPSMVETLLPWPIEQRSADGLEKDAKTDPKASLTAEQLAAFTTRLKKCWSPPASTASASRLTAVVRVALRRDGALAGPPELVEATASPQGPALVEGAMRALKRCEPYGDLPADQYQAWQGLSLTFSPTDVTVTGRAN